MNGVEGDDCVLSGYTGPRTTWANEMNSVMKHAPGAGSIGRPGEQQQATTEHPHPPPFKTAPPIY